LTPHATALHESSKIYQGFVGPLMCQAGAAQDRKYRINFEVDHVGR
jgi:hypothetical protein